MHIVFRVDLVVLVADCTSTLARQFKITGEIHTTEKRRLTQEWAAAFLAAGFNGIRYFVRNDTSLTLVGIALFYTAGQASWPVIKTEPISDALIAKAEQVFGIRVAPPTSIL